MLDRSSCDVWITLTAPARLPDERGQTTAEYALVMLAAAAAVAGLVLAWATKSHRDLASVRRGDRQSRSRDRPGSSIGARPAHGVLRSRPGDGGARARAPRAGAVPARARADRARAATRCSCRTRRGRPCARRASAPSGARVRDAARRTLRRRRGRSAPHRVASAIRSRSSSATSTTRTCRSSGRCIPDVVLHARADDARRAMTSANAATWTISILALAASRSPSCCASASPGSVPRSCSRRGPTPRPTRPRSPAPTRSRSGTAPVRADGCGRDAASDNGARLVVCSCAGDTAEVTVEIDACDRTRARSRACRSWTSAGEPALAP